MISWRYILLLLLVLHFAANIGAKSGGSKKDYYEVLGLNKDATTDQIKRAYHKQALKYHPDKNPDSVEKAQKKFEQVTEAYEVLGDEEKRSLYDRYGHAAFDEPGASGPQSHAHQSHYGQQSSHSSRQFTFNSGDPFGGGGAGFAGGGGTSDPFGSFFFNVWGTVWWRRRQKTFSEGSDDRCFPSGSLYRDCTNGESASAEGVGIGTEDCGQGCTCQNPQGHEKRRKNYHGGQGRPSPWVYGKGGFSIYSKREATPEIFARWR
eukprot:Rmarinus@m.2968